MHSLYSVVEGIFDLPAEMDRASELKVKDKYWVKDITFCTTNWTEYDVKDYIHPAMFKFVEKNNWVMPKRFVGSQRANSKSASMLAAAFDNQPLLGCEQNFMALLRQYAKGEVRLDEVSESRRLKKYYFIISGKETELEIGVTLIPK